MQKLPTVAIVGRPNVGKSSLFNRILGERKAIVEPLSGTTRDRLYATCQWSGKVFRLIDTGGFILAPTQEMLKMIVFQVRCAIEEAEQLLFVCDVTSGIVPMDQEIASVLRKSNKPTILAVNKADNKGLAQAAVDFYQLGLGVPFAVSALHGLGIGELLDEITMGLQPQEYAREKAPIKIAIVGRPNVGKSSLLNCILQEERVIVDESPGTTRDAIDTPFSKDGIDYLLIDTAGIRHKRKLKEAVAFYGISRARQSINRSDLCLVLLDGFQGPTADDLKILDLVHKQGKGCVVIVNKWDLVKGVERKDYEEALKRRAPFINFAPILFTSALTGMGVFEAIEAAPKIAQNRSATIKATILNEELGRFQRARPIPVRSGKRPRLYYITQIGTKPPTFLIFARYPKLIRTEYMRYIENRLRERFALEGTPIRIKFREKMSKKMR